MLTTTDKLTIVINFTTSPKTKTTTMINQRSTNEQKAKGIVSRQRTKIKYNLNLRQLVQTEKVL